MKKIRIPVYTGTQHKSVTGFAVCARPSGSSGCSAVYGSSGSSGVCGASSGSSYTGRYSTPTGTSGLTNTCSYVTRPYTGTTAGSGGTTLQTTSRPDLEHCDVLAFNAASANGYKAGTWTGDTTSVNTIYTQHYAQNATSTLSGDGGYGFVDSDRNGTFDHMFFYSTSGGKTTIYDSNGIAPLKAYDAGTLLNTYYSGKTVRFTPLSK